MSTAVLKNHGLWTPYTPEVHPEGLPPEIIFCKGSSDQDWYEYLNDAASQFTEGSVKLLLRVASGVWTVCSAGRDPSRFFPAGCLMLEVADATQDDPATKYVGQLYTAGVLKTRGEVPPSQADLTAYARAARYAKETGGFMFNGHRVATDDRSKSLILGSLVASQRDANWSTIWQEDAGEFNVNGAIIAAMFDAMQGHVNQCFTIYSSVASGITGGTVTTTAQVDAAYADVG